MAFEAVGLAVGGAALNAFLAVGFDRSSMTRKFIEFFQEKNVIEVDEEILDRLENTMLAISVVLEDAEDKERKSLPVRRWLGKVKHAFNLAEDLLDELNYELLRLKQDYEFQHKHTEADLKSSLDPAVIAKLMPNLKTVTERLEYFVNRIHALGLQKFDSKEKYPYRRPSTSVVNTSQIFGRDDEKEKIIRRMLSDGEDSEVSVIAITGMGGIGKTTLAQLAYNDDQVKKKFQTRAWVCVSEEYDDLKVTRDLLMEVNSDVVDDKDNLNRLQVKLEENLKGKCFLIVLDDIWNENYNDWDILKNSLNHGSRGSKIIVTTRNETIALMMQNEHFHHVEPIKEDQSWCLFKSHAFDKEDHNSLQQFEKIGKEIVKKCNGLPLAIKTVAGALRRKRDINVWHKFLSSDAWAADGGILPALRLSYNHLPSHLKCCFAFCALFPKDVPFEKDEVVLLWMANDLVTQKDGHEDFEELKSRSFFDLVNGKRYIMHDLINDLARSVAGNACIRLEDYQAAGQHQSIQREKVLPPELLHFSYWRNSSSETSEWLKGLAQVQGLRTFLYIHNYRSTFSCSDMFPRLKRLRAIKLSRHDISMVPDSIGDLKHLRFLNLATTEIKRLPNAISKCLNLQTLILANCEELVELPKDMRLLINLQHLDVADCKELVQWPEEMKLLINLQHLDVQGVGEPLIKTMATWFKDIRNISVVVDKIYGNVLEHWDKLQPCHSLNIIGLGDTDVVTTEGATREELKDKDCIENLTLEWSSVAECSDSMDELNKFAKLKPHTNIKQLSINGYEGTRFPDWLGDSAFSNLEILSLINCKNCVFLPPLGQLTGLKKLDISGMDGIRKIDEEFYGDASIPFRALQELTFSDMAELAIWNAHSGGLAAPNLKKLRVRKCSKMKSLPARMHTQLPLLTYLSITECPEIECFPEGGLPSTLERLTIKNCSKMRCQTNWGLQTLLSLKEVWLIGFEDTIFPEEGLLPTTLQHLYITEFSNLESVNEKGFQHLSSLRTLIIADCPNLKYLPQQKFSSSLSDMYIRNCDLVESFPEGLASSLSTLSIWDCPKLAARIEREKGEDWPNVSHIPKIEIHDFIQSDDETTSSEPKVSRLVFSLSELSIEETTCRYGDRRRRTHVI